MLGLSLTKSHRLLLCLTAVLSLSGCVAPAMIPSGGDIAAVKRVRVVAMEALPLGLPWSYQLEYAQPSGIGPLIPTQAGGGSISATRNIAVFNTLLIFVQLTESSYRSYDALRSSQTALDTPGIWSPTVALANEISKELVASGIAAHVAPGFRPIPGVEFRGPTTTMENWLGPIRSYYNYTGPVESYRDLASDQPLHVLEVVISNYEVHWGKLLLQVHLKLIDASGARIIGRVRSNNLRSQPSVEPLQEFLADDAARFKEAFSMTGRQLVKEALAELGLLTPVN